MRLYILIENAKEQTGKQTIMYNENENIQQNTKYRKQRKLYRSICNFSIKKIDNSIIENSNIQNM